MRSRTVIALLTFTSLTALSLGMTEVAHAKKKKSQTDDSAASASASAPATSATTSGDDKAASASSSATAPAPQSCKDDSDCTGRQTCEKGVCTKNRDLEKAPEGKPKDSAVDPYDPTEVPGKTYYFVGVRYRQTFLPKFMLEMFAAGGPDVVSIPTVGFEGTMRKDKFDTTLALTYSDYGMDPFSFHGKNEGPQAWERVSSSLKLVNLTVDFLWGTDFNKYVGLQYGLTAGMALVFGDLKRVQGVPKAGGSATNPNDIIACQGQGNPGPGSNGEAGYCDNSNDHYPIAGTDPTQLNDPKNWYKEKDWFSGGSRPNLYAVFGPVLAVRVKPIKQLAMRFETGFNFFSGFFLGVAGSYGFPPPESKTKTAERE